MKLYHINELERLGELTAVYTDAADSIWRYGEAGALENFSRLAKEFKTVPEKFTKVYQKHTAKTKKIEISNAGEGVLREADAEAFDGMVTNEKGIVLCTTEADCVPVYFFDPVKKAVAMVHSGWRGTAGKISKNAVKALIENYNSRAEDIAAAIGPHICGKCYEVGAELKNDFAVNFSCEQIEKFFRKKSNGKFLLDLEEAIKMTLVESGIKDENIFSTGLCSFENENLCSYRRTGSGIDHTLTAIMLK